jgi:hypothetical protein
MPAKKKQVGLLIKIMTDDKQDRLDRFLGMAEILVYQYYINTFKGEINKIRAFVSPVKEMKANGVPEYNAYVKEVKESGAKYAIDFEIDIVDKEVMNVL